MKKKQQPRLKVQPERLIIWAAKGMFKSARKLADALKPETNRKVLIVRSDSLKFKPRFSDTIINWGNSHLAEWDQLEPVKIVNNMGSIFISVNKLKTFQALQDICNIPEWTTNYETAKQWEGGIISRSVLNGFGGIGIGVHTNLDLPLDSLLYVKYKKKKAEYRVHVFNGEAIDITQKKKRADFENVDTKIRNYANGWVYCREDIEVPDDVREQAIKAVRHLGLDFGAVDVIYNAKEDQAYVLEINSAPGLEGQTIESYKNAILKELQ